MTIAVGYSEQFGILLSKVNALEAKKSFKENNVSGGIEPKDDVNGTQYFSSLLFSLDGAQMTIVARARFSLGSLVFTGKTVILVQCWFKIVVFFKLGKVGNWKGFSWINIFKMVRFNSTVTCVCALPMKQTRACKISWKIDTGV